jgi:outer membrane protein assembly factor BamE (lipoprotein component of BamABCDE complex)
MLKKISVLFSLLILLNSCATKEYRKGHIIHETQKEEVKEAKTKEEIKQTIGSPSLTTIFGEETWIYTYADQKQWAFLPPKETDFEMLVIKFASDDTIKSMNFYGKNKKNNIAMASATTPIPGEVELGFFQELFGNIGRFLPSQLDE